jgi:phosphate uptake regulator
VSSAQVGVDVLQWGIRMYVVSRQIERIGDNAVDIAVAVRIAEEDEPDVVERVSFGTWVSPKT